MLIIDKALKDAVRTGQASKEELVNELMKNNTVYTLAQRLADYIIAYDEARPIVVTQEEYDRITSLFKIRGVRPDGTPENRGKGRRADG